MPAEYIGPEQETLPANVGEMVRHALSGMPTDSSLTLTVTDIPDRSGSPIPFGIREMELNATYDDLRTGGVGRMVLYQDGKAYGIDLDGVDSEAKRDLLCIDDRFTVTVSEPGMFFMQNATPGDRAIYGSWRHAPEQVHDVRLL